MGIGHVPAMHDPAVLGRGIRADPKFFSGLGGKGIWRMHNLRIERHLTAANCPYNMYPASEGFAPRPPPDVHICAVPRTQTRLGDRSFAIAGPRLWNNLPVELRQQDIYMPERV